jgi:hypothetical protein
VTERFRFRVYFCDGVPPRDVTATSTEGAKRTALWAERLIGRKGRVWVSSVERLWAVGWRAQEELFQAEAV